jgi:hypothetical protein
MRGKADGPLARMRASSKRAIDSLRHRTNLPVGSGPAEQWQSVLALQRRANAIGQAFHQFAIRSDPSLHDWVLQADCV